MRINSFPSEIATDKRSISCWRYISNAPFLHQAKVPC